MSGIRIDFMLKGEGVENARILAMAHGVQIWDAPVYENSVHILDTTILAVAGFLDSRRKGRNPKRPPLTQTRRPPGLDVHEGGVPPSQGLSATPAPSMRAATRRRAQQRVLVEHVTRVVRF